MAFHLVRPAVKGGVDAQGAVQIVAAQPVFRFIAEGHVARGACAVEQAHLAKVGAVLQHVQPYTGQELGNARLYDLCVNTSDYGLERTVELILEAINTRNEQSSAVETVPVRPASFPEPEEDSIPGEISLA